MLTTILIDDEFKPRELLAIKIQELCPQLDIVGKASSAQEGYEMCMKLKPELVFLDISMPQESGFDFIKKFDKVDFEVIFATAHNEFAIDAFNFSAVGYLLKPIENEALINAVDAAIKQKNYKYSLIRYEALIENHNMISNENQKLVIPSNEGYEIVIIKDILCFEGTDKYTYIHVNDGRKILSSNNIGKYKNLLESNGFFVCHKSYIVNMKFIRTLTTDDDIVLSNNFKVPLARRRKIEFMQLLAK
jgi:two-component system, LytTR family, response regulator